MIDSRAYVCCDRQASWRTDGEREGEGGGLFDVNRELTAVPVNPDINGANFLFANLVREVRRS